MPTVLVTGANRGLGFEFVRQYVADGVDIIAVCREPAKAEALQKFAAGSKRIRIEKLEVTDAGSIKALAARLGDTAIDILINNAGVSSSGDASAPSRVEDVDPRWQFGGLEPDIYLNVMNVNAVAPIMVTQALMPQVLRGHGKKIVMISSRLGSIESMTRPGLFAYSASKAALNMGMRKIAGVVKPQGITVISLHPGWTQTDMGGPKAEFTVEESVSGMRKVIGGLTMENSGQFIGHDGKTVAW